jgi:hypothetical protein
MSAPVVPRVHELAGLPPSVPRGLAAVAVLGFVLVVIATEWAYRAPAPHGADAPATEFSAARAHAVLTRLLGDEAPHPLGSAANAEVRARVCEELEALGLDVEVQTELATRRGMVARVYNVLARIDGGQPGKALLLAAHYDSVGAGPGASDDGVAVAAMLETARALLAGPKLAHPVILLIDDGEELGLFGARAFCAAHPWAKDVAAVLNFEARGTQGPSLLFETAGDDQWLMQHAARALRRPITGSAFAAVYRALPNSTDLAVFRQYMPGLNFAFIEGARRYHTPLDDLTHADRGSLQHHGDNMLALARNLADDPALGQAPPGRAVFFDVLARYLVVVPAAWEVPAAAGVFVLWLVVCLVKRRRGTLRVRLLLQGLALAAAALLVAGALGLALGSASIGLGSLPTPFPPEPVVHAVGYALAGIGTVLMLLRIARARIEPWHLFTALGGLTSALAVMTALVFPGASYLFAIPAAAACLGTLCTHRAGVVLGVFASLSALASALVLAPFFVLLPTAIGLRAGAAHAAVAAWAALGLAIPLFALLGARLLPAACVCLLAAPCAVAYAALRPAHDRHHPARANIVYLQQEKPAPMWFLDDAEPFGPWVHGFTAPLPWERPGWCVEAPALDLPPPQAEITARDPALGKQVVSGHMRSRRDAPWLTLWLPPGMRIENPTLAGMKVTPAPGRNGWQSLSFLGAEPDEKIPFTFTTQGTARAPLHVADRTLGLPPEARELVEHRARALAAPIHLGDGVVVVARVEDG